MWEVEARGAYILGGPHLCGVSKANLDYMRLYLKKKIKNKKYCPCRYIIVNFSFKKKMYFSLSANRVELTPRWEMLIPTWRHQALRGLSFRFLCLSLIIRIQ